MPPAAVTPGIVSSPLASSSWKDARRASSYRLVGRLTSNVRTRSTRTPRFTCCNPYRLARRTAAPASSVSASATCAAASAPRSRASPRAPVAERDCWRSASTGAVPARRRAGAIPKATAVTAVATSAKSSTSPSRPTSSSRGSACAPEGLQHANPGGSQGESRHTAKERQQEALDQELAHESRPARAERGADRELVHATGRADEGEVGHVHAGYEQDEAHRGEHQVQRASRARHELFAQRHRDNRALLRGRPALPHRRRQRCQFGPGLFQGDAVAQAADGGQRVVLFISVAGKMRTGSMPPHPGRSGPRSRTMRSRPLPPVSHSVESSCRRWRDRCRNAFARSRR